MPTPSNMISAAPFLTASSSFWQLLLTCGNSRAATHMRQLTCDNSRAATHVRQLTCGNSKGKKRAEARSGFRLIRARITSMNAEAEAFLGTKVRVTWHYFTSLTLAFRK